MAIEPRVVQQQKNQNWIKQKNILMLSIKTDDDEELNIEEIINTRWY